MVAVFEANDLRKTYRAGNLSVDVLRGVNLTIQPGEFVALLGPSGSGKSTLLYILGMMEPATSGTLRFAGSDVGAFTRRQMADVRRRQIGFVFQTFNLLPTLTAEENVALPLRLARVSAGERRAKARELLAAVGLDDRSRHRPMDLSGGERQRVAIARALANSPQVVLADEPTGNLDSEMTRTVMDTLAEANRQGTTLLVVTHNEDVSSYADRMLRMRDGAVADVVPQVPAR